VVNIYHRQFIFRLSSYFLAVRAENNRPLAELDRRLPLESQANQTIIMDR
jgi:hypothetical protein